MNKKTLSIQERVREANKVIAIVSKQGRRFFYSSIHDRVARLGLDKVEQVWYVDEHTGMKIHPAGGKEWPGFTHGSTLKYFITALAHYANTGEKMGLHNFPLEDDASRWAYGQDVMRQVRAEVLETDAVQGES